MYNDQFVTQWVLDTIKEKYAEDIALVISHSALNIDDQERVVSYFVPVTDQGRQFARTFILDGRGYDLWGIEWGRLERFAALEEYNITVLADREVLYARSPEDAARFEALKQKMMDNLADDGKAHKCALESYATAKELCVELMFAQGSDIRLYAGYVLDYLARAIAFTNHRYFRKSQIEQLEELKTMEQVPEGFAEQYLEVLRISDDERRKKLCHNLVMMVERFLSRGETEAVERNFQDLADWYGELSYTWLRIRHYGAANDPVKVHMWGIYLQNELNEVCADFGLPKMELMSEFDYEDLSKIVSRANALEAEMREHIRRGGGIIREYKSIEEFFHEV